MDGKGAAREGPRGGKATDENPPRPRGSSGEADSIGLVSVLAAVALTVVGVVLHSFVGALPAVCLTTGLVMTAGAGLRCRTTRGRRVRTVVVGSFSSLHTLECELLFAGIERYVLVGRISFGDSAADDSSVLGRLEDLRDVVVRHDISLVLMTREVSRGAVFDAMAGSCDDLPVQLWDIPGFYEDTFRCVPLAEINAAWFQHILHPRYRPPSAAAKRAFDVAFAICVGLLTLPLLILVMALIRRDGPVLFRQTRIGEAGRPFTIYKLRTMTSARDSEPQWSSAEDLRVTGLGRRLRRTHLDELPQLWNILRGDMSVVGPRPEQPAFVSRLEREFPFYRRRHQLRPGLTGWAQARCGYAGSCDGTAWKLSHDLYYLKYRSHAIDFRILVETSRHIVFGSQYGEPRSVSFITPRAEHARVSGS